MRNRSLILPLGIFLLAAVLMTTASRRMSTTVDETHYAGVGRYLLERGDWNLKGAILHPPLSYYLNSLFLFSLPVPDGVWEEPYQDERGRALFRCGSGDTVLFLSRLPTILVTLLLLGLVYHEARRLFGAAAGVLALLLTALEPNMLAHGSLATQDMLLTATLFWTVISYRRFREKGGRGWPWIAGIAFGLALLSKFTAVLLLGILPLAVLADRGGRRVFLKIVPACLLALAILHAGYAPLHIHDKGDEWPPGYLVLPGPYGAGVQYQAQANEGHHAYFMDEISDKGWRAYYPVAFLVKTSVPFLLFAAAGVIFLYRKRDRSNASWLLLPPLVLVLFFIFVSRINIGVRYLLPVYPFLAVLGGSAVAFMKGRWTRAATLLLAVWCVAGAWIAHPHYISYFNELVWGPEGGARILSDSNLDWGQDLPGLKKFLDDNGYPGVYLAYFGNGSPERYGIRYRWLPGWLYKVDSRIYEESLAFHPSPELVAISRMNMQGVWLPDRKIYAWLNDYPRIADIGHSILIFDITGSSEAHDRIAEVYHRRRRIDLMHDELAISSGLDRGGP